MGHQIIKQPDGRYCVFSSVVDNFIMYDATADEVCDYYSEKAKQETRELICKIEGGNSPYYGHFNLSLPEAVQIAKRVHGKLYNEIEEWIKRIDKDQ